MEPLSQKLVPPTTSSRCEGERSSALLRNMRSLLALAALVLTTGCVSLGSFLTSNGDKSTSSICQVVATWTHDIRFTPDPTHGGADIPGLAGRLYLFGQEVSFPL